MLVTELRDQVEQNAEPEIRHSDTHGSWSYQIASTDGGWLYRWQVDVRRPEFAGEAHPWGPYRDPRPTERGEALRAVLGHIERFLVRCNAPQRLVDELHAADAPTLF